MFPTLPVLALLFNAFVWGVSWWPFRLLESHGLHPLWSTALIYAVAVALLLATQPGALRGVLRTPTLWLILIGSGLTNAAFNWGVVIGDVVRVVLLFYLMPLWVVLLARLLLHEPVTRRGLLRVALAVGGAFVVLSPGGGDGAGWGDVGQLPLPRSLADWLGLIGGFTFAMNTVMLRREAARPFAHRALAMFIGGMSVSALLATGLAAQGAVAWPPAPAGWMLWALGLAAVFLLGNLGLQYGASHLPANATAVVMLTEVLFAAVSALWLGGGVITQPLALGGALIVSAAVLAAFEPGPAH